MNRGALQSSPVQQITAAGNPNWWNINTSAARPPPSNHHHHHHNNHQFPPPLPTNNFHLFQAPQTYQYSSNFTLSSSSSSPPPCNWPLNNDGYGDNTHQDQITAASWSQLFLSGLVGDEEKELMNRFPEHQQAMEDHVTQENSSCGFVYATNEENFQVCNKPNTTTTTTTTNCWSPQSCITTTAKPDPPPAMVDRNSECNSSAAVNGGTVKKAKVQSSATQSTFKVRKFGDRITGLHQLVSPFGKTDTASVLLEAIGYIRFLQSQIEALSIPYLNGTGYGNNKRQQHPQSVSKVPGERNCIFPEDPGQLLNDNCLKRKGGPEQEELRKDLRSRGLCLVPVSCTLHVGRDNGADYWAPMLGGFR